MIYDFDNLSFQVLTIIRHKHDEGFFDVKGRPFSAMGFRIRGSGEFQIGDERFTSEEGSIVFIPRDVSYRVKYTDGESIVVHFSKCNYSYAENFNFENPSALYSKFTALLNEWNDNHRVNKAKSLIYDILECVTDEKAVYANDEEFVRCVDYINDNFADAEFAVSDMSRMLFISESGLRRKFAKYYKMSPKQYMQNLRINKAVEMLTSGQYTIKTISATCGFKDEKYFSRVIKKRFGRSPSELARKFVL